MAVTSIKERFDERRGSQTTSERTLRRAFLVDTDNKNDDATVVLSHPDIVSIGAAHPNDAGTWCQSRTADQFEGSTHWLVTADYSSRLELDDTSPENDAAEITWTTEQFQVVAEKDRNGDALVNSAGDPFDPPPTRDFSRRVVTIKKNVTAVPSWVLDYEDAVNSASIEIGGLTIGAEKAKLQRVDIGHKQIRGTSEFYPMTFEIHLSRDGWALEPLDQGFREVNGSGQRVLITNDGDNEPVTQPALLDGSGAAIADPEPDDAVYLTYDVYQLRDFSVLPLS